MIAFDVNKAEEALRQIINELRSAVVAYSGGVDSALLLAVAHQELGERVLGVTAVSPSVASGEIEAAAELARRIGARHEVIATHEFDNPNYRANPKNRCYYCKEELFTRLSDLARDRGYDNVVDGFNADDGRAALDVRPGHEAALRLGIRSPLAEAQLGKQQIRKIAKRLGLPVWNKPATPCLSSRVPYGTAIEVEDLRRIDVAEQYLRAIGFSVVRIRHYGATARIEVPLEQLEKLEKSRARVSQALRQIGYSRVEIDPRGYRMGSLNSAT